MKIFIIGAAGGVGSRLIPLLASTGHKPISMHRRPEQAERLAAAGSAPIAGDLVTLSARELAELMKGAEAVVFSAGAGGAGYDLTNAIDGDGLVKAVAAAKIAGIDRFLLVSAFPEAGRGGEPKPGFENYMKVKKRTDAHLAQSGLDWVILRPGTLKDDEGTGRVNAGLALEYGSVPRGDVAATLAAIIDRPELSHIIIELTEGDQPIGDALDRLAG